MKTRIALLSLALAGLTGCQPQVNCANEEGISNVVELLQNEVQKRTMRDVSLENIQSIGEAEVRAALSGIAITLHAFRTDKKDPNSNKVFCAAQIKYVLDTEKMTALDHALDAHTPGSSLSNYAQMFEFEQAANAFVSNVHYSVQPTDDGSMIYTEMALDTPATEFLETLVHADILRAASASSAKAVRTTAHIAQIEQLVSHSAVRAFGSIPKARSGV